MLSDITINIGTSKHLRSNRFLTYFVYTVIEIFAALHIFFLDIKLLQIKLEDGKMLHNLKVSSNEKLFSNKMYHN